jgi:hypothetical protein
MFSLRCDDDNEDEDEDDDEQSSFVVPSKIIKNQN